MPLRELLQDLLEHLGGIILATVGALAAALSGGIVLTMVVMVMMVAVDAMAALIQTMHS